jgi:cell cycle sensor histidine kinase DivJ
MNEERMRLDVARRGEYAKLINDSGTHLLSVVNGILDMSKMETGDFEISPEPFAPAQVIGNCCDILALKAREGGLDLSMRLPADLPEIIADKRAFKQILLNLVSNAVKFTDRGGHVTVTARVEGADILIAVEDTGVGISDTDLSQVGRPFFQARAAYDRRHDGTGLGLSIVRGLVDLHGGKVDIKSQLGEGTRVAVRMPLNCENARPSAGRASNVSHPSFDRVVEAADLLIKKSA